MPHLLVLGLGPAGRIISARAKQRGWSVTAHDPHPSSPPHIGAWESQLPDWFPHPPGDYPTVIFSDGSTRVLPEKYVMVDVPLPAAGDDSMPGGAPDLVIDTRPGPALKARQYALGAWVPESAMTDKRVVLMDFRKVADTEFSTFNYRVRVGDRWLVEETVVAAYPQDRDRVFEDLRAALEARLRALRIRPADFEIVDFPLGCRPPLIPRPFPLGARGGFMHPATGYSVGMVLAAADDVLSGRFSWPRHLALWGLRWLGLQVLLLKRRNVTGFFELFFSLPERHVMGYVRGSLAETCRSMLSLAWLVVRKKSAPTRKTRGRGVARGRLQ